MPISPHTPHKGDTMKKAAITGIVIGVLALGVTGGNLVVSQMLENRIRDSLGNPPSGMQAQCDDVRVSFLRRSVTLSNLRLSVPTGEQNCRELVLRPSFSLLLAGSFPSLRSTLLPESGPVVMGDATVQDMQLRTVQTGDDPAATLKTLNASGVFLNADLFAEILQGKRPAPEDLVGKAGVESIDAVQLRLQPMATDPFVKGVESIRLRNIVLGTSAKLVEMTQLQVFGINKSPDASLSLLRLTDIALPPELSRRILSGAARPADFERALMAMDHPFYRTLTLEEGQIILDGQSMGCRRIFHDWRSTAPMHSISKIEQLNLPAEGRLSVPGLKRLIIDMDGEHLQQGALFLDKATVNVADIGTLALEAEHNIDVFQLNPDDSNSALQLLGAQFRKAYLHYKDKGGIARLLALFITRKESISQVDAIAAQIPAALPGEINKPLVDALRTTLLTPGTLELRLHDGMTMTALDMMDINVIGRMFEVSAVPGKTSVKTQILSVLGQ